MLSSLHYGANLTIVQFLNPGRIQEDAARTGNRARRQVLPELAAHNTVVTVRLADLAPDSTELAAVDLPLGLVNVSHPAARDPSRLRWLQHTCPFEEQHKESLKWSRERAAPIAWRALRAGRRRVRGTSLDMEYAASVCLLHWPSLGTRRSPHHARVAEACYLIEERDHNRPAKDRQQL